MAAVYLLLALSPFQFSFRSVSMLLVLLSLLRLSSKGQCYGTTVALTAAFGRLDLAELQEQLFEVGIADRPITQQTAVRDGKTSVMVWSRHGQQYSCELPGAATDTADSPVVLEDKLVNVSKLLVPLRGKCYYKNEGWWTYRYCHGDQVTQFHIEAGKTTGDIIVLGKFEQEKLWDKEELLKMAKRQSVQKLHAKSVEFTMMSVTSHEADYVNGTLCGINGKRRYTKVKFICHLQPGKTEILKVVEEATCNYTLILHTPLLCNHPAFKPYQDEADPIICTPVVSEEMYREFLKQEEQAQIQNKEKKAHEKEEEKVAAVEKGQELGGKSHSNDPPLSVVLNSLASSVVEKLQQKKSEASKKRKKSSGSGDTGEKEEEDDRDLNDMFDDKEVDAMIDEMVAETLENIMGVKMPSSKSTQPDAQGNRDTADSLSTSAVHEHEPGHRAEHSNEHKTEHSTERETKRRAKHGTGHRAEHSTERETERRAKHGTGPRTEHSTERETERRAKHGTGHRAEHSGKHRAEHSTEHETEHRAKHGTGHRAEHSTEHGTERRAKHGTGHRAEHRTAQGTKPTKRSNRHSAEHNFGDNDEVSVVSATIHETDIDEGSGKPKAKLKVKVYKLKDGHASEQSDQVDDSEHKRTGSKVVDLEKRKSDDVLSMLGGIIGEIMDMELEAQEPSQLKNKQKLLEQRYAGSWEKEGEEKEEEDGI